MPLKLDLSEDKKLLELTFESYNTADEIMDLVKQAIDIQKQHGTMLFLTDCTSFVSNNPNAIFIAYQIVEKFDEYGAHHKSRLAIISPTDGMMKGFVSFFELAASNKGYKVKVFDTKEDVSDWLLQKA
jgi:hypothetical protein